MMNITLNFVNQSNGISADSIAIFQKNVASISDSPVAWVVFDNPAKGTAFPFQYNFPATVAASDSFGNTTSQLSAPNGCRFDMMSSVQGNQLRLSKHPAIAPVAIEVYNELPVGAINAMVYNNGLLCAQKTGIAPGQKADFVFEPSLYIALGNGIQQGDLLDATETANPAFISLLGIRSADIYMVGGGSGTDAKPIEFFLQNVIMA